MRVAIAESFASTGGGRVVLVVRREVRPVGSLQARRWQAGGGGDGVTHWPGPRSSPRLERTLTCPPEEGRAAGGIARAGPAGLPPAPPLG